MRDNEEGAKCHDDFPSFSEGLSLRVHKEGCGIREDKDFPSFSEGLSLRAP